MLGKKLGGEHRLNNYLDATAFEAFIGILETFTGRHFLRLFVTSVCKFRYCVNISDPTLMGWAVVM
jgi:hypothetical protein